MIIGLGNPGAKYKATRHNIGFMVVDALMEKLRIKLDQRKFQAEYALVTINQEKVLIAKPLTFMNNCGEAIASLMRYYQIHSDDIIVIYDDVDLPCGKLRLRSQGNSGGHNGIKSIIKHSGTKDFKRIRIGIDKDPLIVTADYVLGKPNTGQKKLLKLAIVLAADAAYEFIDTDFNLVMNKYNTHE